MDNFNKDYSGILEKVLLETVKEQRRARRWKIFFRLIWLLFAIFVLFNIFGGGSNKELVKTDIIKNTRKLALIDLSGAIDSDNKTYANLSQSLNNALKDKTIMAVIIRANSPGGSPVYSDMLYNEILRLRKLYPNKPISVVVEQVCASGCYYIASAANNIYANPASIVGSIGVISPNFGFNKLMEKVGVESRLLTAGKYKAMGYPFAAKNPDEIAIEQDMLDKIHKQFIQAVTNGRGHRLHADPDLFSGRYWLGQDAYKLGLIDGLSTVDELAREVYKTDNVVDFTVTPDLLGKYLAKMGVTLSNVAQNILYYGNDMR